MPETVTEPTRLVLIRHGESNATVERRIGGHRTCTGLSPHGIAQTEALAARLAASGELVGAALYASHYPRAIETAERLVPALGGPELVIEDGFGEHDPGPECDGLSFDEFLERHGTPDWEHDPFAVSFPGGETLAAFRFRVGQALHRVMGEHRGGTVVVCCHGGVIDAVIRLALHTLSVGGFELFTSNTSISELLLVRHGRWRLVRYNDVGHLADLAPWT